MTLTLAKMSIWTSLGAVAAGCASTPEVVAPEVPPALRVPAGQKAFLEAFATGFQVYECVPKADKPEASEWAFVAPEATLADRAGRPLGKHYAGPTWEATDGSKVTGEVKAREASPLPGAIPWLLLSAKTVSGPGLFGKTMSIQRVATAGGAAPGEACRPGGGIKKVARVPYTASYYFYGTAP